MKLFAAVLEGCWGEVMCDDGFYRCLVTGWGWMQRDSKN